MLNYQFWNEDYLSACIVKYFINFILFSTIIHCYLSKCFCFLNAEREEVKDKLVGSIKLFISNLRNEAKYCHPSGMIGTFL